MIGSYCPTILFPYAREVMSDLVIRGGFPQLVLESGEFRCPVCSARQGDAGQSRLANSHDAYDHPLHHTAAGASPCRPGLTTGNITVLGAGAWGTTLAILLARNHHSGAAMGPRPPAHATRWPSRRCNTRAPGGYPLSRHPGASPPDLDQAVAARHRSTHRRPQPRLPAPAGGAGPPPPARHAGGMGHQGPGAGQRTVPASGGGRGPRGRWTPG